MKNLLVTSFCFLLFSSTISSQDFNSAVGLRIGNPVGLTYKKFISQSNAIEAYVGYKSNIFARNFSLNGAFQIHKDIEDISGLQYFYGAGLTAGRWNLRDNVNSTSLGLQGYIGLSYTLDDFPINISIDLVPTVLINHQPTYETGFSLRYGSIAARYILGSNANNIE